MIKIGVLSDTHGYLDPKIIPLFQGVMQILHAGDIGSLEVITQLEKVAPVIAVHGNGDINSVLKRFPDRQIVTVSSNNILLTHIGGPLTRLKNLLPEGMSLEDIDMVIYGHSHSPEFRQREGLFFFNPGAASIKMCYVTPSVGLLTIGEGKIKGDIVTF